MSGANRADSLARAVAVVRYLLEFGDDGQAVLDETRRILTRELDERGGAADIPWFEPEDSRVDATTVRQAAVTLSKVEELVGPAETRILQDAADVLDDYQAEMEARA